MIPALIADELAANHPARVRPEVHPDMTLAEIGCDAIDRIVIALAIEDRFGVVVTDADKDSWHTVADVAAAIAKTCETNNITEGD